MKRRCLVLAVSLTVGSAPAVLAVPAATASPGPDCTPVVDRDLSSSQDIDNSGRADFIVGLPHRTVAGRADSGGFDIHYDPVARPSAPDTTRTERITESTASFGPVGRGDRFGASVASGDLDGDACADVIVGVPGFNGGRGEIIIATGSPSGPVASARVTGTRPGEHLGASVGILDHRVIGAAPDASVAGRRNAGRIEIITASGVVAKKISEASTGVPGKVAAGDRFGARMSVNDSRNLLAVGMPAKTVGGAKRAGAVEILYFGSSANRLLHAYSLTQRSAGVPGNAERGDRFGTSVSLGYSQFGDELAVGVPGENVGGSVQTFTVHNGKPESDRVLHEGSHHLHGTPKAGDGFGASVYLGNFAFCANDDITTDLAIGIPGKKIHGHADAGAVIVTYAAKPDFVSTDTNPQCGQLLTEGRSTAGLLGGAPERGDLTGERLSGIPDSSSESNETSGGATLVIGVPGEDAGGSANTGTAILYLHTYAKGPADAPLRRPGGRHAGDRYGQVLGSGSDNGFAEQG
jgi:hypothetical protein